MRSVTTTSVLAAAALAIAIPALAQAPDPVKARQANMKAVTATMKELTDQQRTRSTDWAKVAASSAKLSAQAKSMPSWFAAGGAGGESKTKAEAFSNKADFDAELKKFVNVTTPLATVAKNRDKTQLTTQMDAVRESCVSCHSKYREKV